MARRKQQLKSLSDVMKAPGPDPDSKEKYIQYSFAGVMNLYIAVWVNLARIFQFKMTFRGIPYFITLGHLGEIPLNEAINKTQQYRQMIKSGIDPRKHHGSNGVMTLKQFVDEYFWPYVRENYKSYRNVRNMLDKRILPVFGHMLLSQINKGVIRLFCQQMLEEVNIGTGRKVGGATVNRTLALLSSLFKFALEHDFVGVNPCVGVRKAKEKKSRDRHLQSDEYPKIMPEVLAMIHCPQGQVILLLAVLGLRPGEVMKLLWSDVQLADRRFYIRDPKNGESRYVPLNTIAFDLLSTMFESRDKSIKWVFPSNSATGHLLSVRKTFATICKKSGVLDFQLRDLRRSHATLLLQSGEVDLLTIKSVLGHKCLASTLVYARVGNAAMVDANELAASRFTEAINA